MSRVVLNVLMDDVIAEGRPEWYEAVWKAVELYPGLAVVRFTCSGGRWSEGGEMIDGYYTLGGHRVEFSCWPRVGFGVNAED